MPARLDRDSVSSFFNRVRATTETLTAALSAEDMVVQSMADASPTKWHLAHTTWFFEEFLLEPFDPSHRWHDERWRFLFNSYYVAVGPRHARAARGVLSRPSFEEIRGWRSHVDEQVRGLLSRAGDEVLAIALLGSHHEQQHQELILTDIKHAFWSNELRPAYRAPPPLARTSLAPSALAAPHGSVESPPTSRQTQSRTTLTWLTSEQRVVVAGDAGEGFAFDNERPEHRAIVGPFGIASRLVTNGEYLRFVEDGGYERPDLWLADGWSWVQAQHLGAPLYWEPGPHGWSRFTFQGQSPVELDAPVSHVSFYEADAYARWAEARLPTEHEWEATAAARPVEGNFLESGRLDPVPATGESLQLFGDAWEWTASAYLPYPRFQPLPGALGEYNGKFMSGQMVLRGGSCLSPRSHIRPTYRNFFPPSARWQMAGFRLARDH